MTGNPLKKCDFRFFNAKNDLCQLNAAFLTVAKSVFATVFLLELPTIQISQLYKKIEKNADFCPICNSFATVTKKRFENREFIKAEVAGSMGLSAVIARLLSHFY